MTNIVLNGANEPVKESWASWDWNSGPGPLYYDDALTQKGMIKRLLMLGAVESETSDEIDISRGQIYGMDISKDTNGCYVDTGLFGGTNMNRINPHH